MTFMSSTFVALALIAAVVTAQYSPYNPALINPALGAFNPALTNPAAIMNPALSAYNPALMTPAHSGFNPALTNPALTNPAMINPALLSSTYNPALMNPALGLGLGIGVSPLTNPLGYSGINPYQSPSFYGMYPQSGLGRGLNAGLYGGGYPNLATPFSPLRYPTFGK